MKDGGPAFPLQRYPESNPDAVYQELGMTLRDYFAGKVMEGIVLAERIDGGNLMPSKLARTAYKIASAMLKERGEEGMEA